MHDKAEGRGNSVGVALNHSARKIADLSKRGASGVRQGTREGAGSVAAFFRGVKHGLKNG